MQNPRNPFSYRMEIGSSSNIQNSRKKIRSSSFSSPKCYHPGKVIKTIIDPIRKDTYLLKEEIGYSSNGYCHVYRAVYSKYHMENGSLVPSGYVTLKTINKKVYENESNQLQRKIHDSIGYIPCINLIGLEKTFRTEDLLCISLPYMSQGSLRHILSTRPGKILVEDLIAIVLKQALIVLRDHLHTDFCPRAHKTLNAGDIFVHIDNDTDEMLIKLAFEASTYHSENINAEENPNLEEASSSSSFLDPKGISNWGAAPEVYEIENAIRGPKSDIWLLGITALELAYGDLPVRSREDLDLIIRKIRKKKRLPISLEKLLVIKKKKGKFQKALDLFKPKEKVFPKKFERMVLKCLSENPAKRPTVEQLLSSSFFTMQRDIEKFRRFVLNA